MAKNYANEITSYLADVPNEIAIPVLSDINRRITDWLADGGKGDDPYIVQQVRYAKAIGNKFGIESKEGANG